MSAAARGEVHGFVHRLWQDPALRERFTADPRGVLAEQELTAQEQALMADGGFPALAELGMHPLAQMVYSLALTPAMAGHISFSDYLDDLD